LKQKGAYWYSERLFLWEKLMHKLKGASKHRKLKPERGFVLYKGPSTLDGKPIIVVATLASKNDKTGNMVQVWIIREDIEPLQASKLGDDISICGNCVHRHYHNGACYVNIGQAPNGVYRAYKRGIYPLFDREKHSAYITGRKIRLGAYGDPAATPYDVLSDFVALGIGHTGYTHQVNHKNFDKRFLSLLMVSVDTPKQALKLQNGGVKTFRVALRDDAILPYEIECLADSSGLTCLDCGICDGSKKSVVVQIHGSRQKKFKSKYSYNLIASLK
jgi:hypothetical protein